MKVQFCALPPDGARIAASRTCVIKSSGTGSAEVVYTVEKGGLAARTDAIVINGRAVTVSQAGLR